MEALITGLMLFASAHTGLPMPSSPPDVERVSQSSLNVLAPTVAARLPAGTRLAGTYRHDVVYVRDDFDERSAIAQSVLLHELVHYMQDAEGQLARTATTCPGRDIEAPAYAAQAAWLEHAGVDPSLLGLTPARLAGMAASC